MIDYYLVLDDMRSIGDVNRRSPIGHEVPINKKVVLVKDYKEFITCIKKLGVPIHVWFDHDLSIDQSMHGTYDDKEEKTGLDCAKFLVNYCSENNLTFPDYYAHTGNALGKLNIESYIESYKKSLKI